MVTQSISCGLPSPPSPLKGEAARAHVVRAAYPFNQLATDRSYQARESPNKVIDVINVL